MNKMFSLITTGWIGTATTFIMAHFNTLISISCGIFTLIASIYGIAVSRVELKLRKKQLKEGSKRGLGGLLMPAVLVVSMFLIGCVSTAPNWIDRNLYTVSTNYTPHVFVQTNTVTITNIMPWIIERVVNVTNSTGISATTIYVTNLQEVVTVQTNVVTVTNIVQAISLAAKPGVEDTLRATGSAAGGPWGVGGIAAALLGGAYHVYMQIRNKQVNKALVQGTQVARELLETTPQGQALATQYKGWLVSHQKSAGVIGVVSDLVDSFVDNEAAKNAARIIAGDIPKPQST